MTVARKQRTKKATPTRAERNIAWIENTLRIPEGKSVGKPFKLAEFQKDIVRRIYDNPAETRRAIVSLPRKNAKSTLCACLLLLHLIGPEATQNSQLYSAARSREQASVVFRLVSKMILMSPVLREWTTIRESTKTILVPELGTEYRALSSDAANQMGLSPKFTVHDELGQVRGPVDRLYEALETASAAHENPLTLVISTQAESDGDLLSALIDDAATGEDPRTVLVLHACPKDIDWSSPAALEAAHPAWNEFINKRELLSDQAQAKRIGSMEPGFRNLTLNQRVASHAVFVLPEVWDENGAVGDDWRGKDLIIGLDLSQVSDLTSITITHRENGITSVHPFFWLPDDNLSAKAQSDKVPWVIWRDNGMLNTTPGRSINHQFTAKFLWDVCQEAKSVKIVYDRWKINEFKRLMIDVGFTEAWLDEHMINFGQGFKDMTPAVAAVERALLDGKIRHGNHPILTMCMNNCIVESGPANGRKLEKRASNRRIDGAVTLAMCMGAWATELEVEKKPRSYLEYADLLVL